MGMPRFARGAPLSSNSLNQMAQELDYQGLACRVRRSMPASLNTDTNYYVTWQVEDYDTLGGGMWNPAAPGYVVIRVSGTYQIEAQQRWGTEAGGQRAGKLLINSTDVFSLDPQAGPITSAKMPADTTGEGVTFSLTATLPLFAGDRIYMNCWHNAGSTISGLRQDFGGTYMAVTRQAPMT